MVWIVVINVEDVAIYSELYAFFPFSEWNVAEFPSLLTKFRIVYIAVREVPPDLQDL